MSRHEKEKKTIDVKRVVTHLNHLFSSATDGMERPARDKNGPNTLYKLQQDFSYFIDEIQRGPIYQLPKIIDDCNVFINKILENKKRESTQ